MTASAFHAPSQGLTLVPSAGDSPDDRVVTLAARIDIHSPLSIQEFASDIADSSGRYTDEILRSARTGDLDEVGKQLTQIVAAAQEFDFRSLDNPTARTPLIGGLLKRLMMSKEKAIARFDSVKDQVDKLVQQVEQTAALLGRRNADYQAMYEGVREEYALLGLHVAAIELKLEEIEQALARPLEDSTDLEAAERFAVLEASRHQLAKRGDDLRVLQHAAMQMLPMVRIIQSNNIALVDKFKTIRQLTLPAWKRAFVMALTLDEQKNAVELANTIDDATNSLMKRNAELLRQNSVATAKANQRLVVDVETLKHVHEEILQTLADVRDEHLNGAETRRKAISEIAKLRTEMTAATKSVGLTHV